MLIVYKLLCLLAQQTKISKIGLIYVIKFFSNEYRVDKKFIDHIGKKLQFDIILDKIRFKDFDLFFILVFIDNNINIEL